MIHNPRQQPSIMELERRTPATRAVCSVLSVRQRWLRHTHFMYTEEPNRAGTHLNSSRGTAVCGRAGTVGRCCLADPTRAQPSASGVSFVRSIWRDALSLEARAFVLIGGLGVRPVLAGRNGPEALCQMPRLEPGEVPS